MNPGVSTSETTGRPKASQSCRKRAALSAASLVIAPAMWRVSLAITPERPALDPRQGGHHLGREALAQEGDRALVDERLDDRRRRRRRGGALRHHLAQPLLAGRGAWRRRALEVAEQPPGRGRRLPLVGHDQVDDPVARLHLQRADLVGRRPCRGRRPRSSPARPSPARRSRWRRSGPRSRRSPRCRRSSARRRRRSAARVQRAAPTARRRGRRAPRRPGSRCRRAGPPPPSAKKTVGRRMRSISSKSLSFLRCPSAPWVPARTV